MDKISMDFLNDSVLALFGRADFVGGIDNEALDFGQLEPFVHLPVISTSQNNGNASAITIAITAVSTTPAHTITTASASVTSTNPPTHGTLPESPPDSGSEPPYSPTDLHAISNLNQMQYQQHNYPTNSQPSNPHQLDQAMHVNETSGVDCHTANLVNGNNNNSSSIHKTEDIMLSASAMPLSNIMPGNDMMMHQNTQSLLGLGIHQINMGRNNVYRGDGNSLLSLATEDDFSCLMSDPMFQLSTQHGMNGHSNQNNHQPQQHQHQQQPQQTATSHPNVNSYNPHVLSQMSATVVPTSHSAEIPHMLNTRKRTMSTMAQQNEYNAQSILENGNNDQQSIGCGIPIKRSTSVILPAIKPEPDALSPSCVSTLIEPATPPSKSSVDVCSNISSCSTSITSPSSTSVMMSGIVEPNSSPNQQSQGQSAQGNNSSGENGSSDSFPMQCIRFSPFQQQNWHILCDQSLQELPLPHYRVDADKGFNFSNSDDAFVCQKKNHFQITCHAQAQGAPAIFVRTESGLEKIKSFHLHFYGVKLETPTQTIRIEQSQSDRSKKPFHPVPIDLQSRQVSKITVGRLHFSETTSNNMRKKGRPNPEQRYFQLVVGLHAHTHSGNFPVISQGSERIIVRASNPGQFESDVELCWQRGVTQDSIFTHASRVGINTDRPDESLVVHGNLKVSGHIVHPSDSRAKQEIGELDTSQQLQNVKRIRVVKYRYDPEFAAHHGLTNKPAVHSTKFNKTNERNGTNTPQSDVIDIIDTGVIAQEVREVLPDAVQEAGSVLLPSGEVIDNFLLVNKDRIYMENIGAVKELCKVTGSLETRIEQLERMNSRLVHVRKLDQCKPDCTHSKCKFSQYDDDSTEPCSNKMIQITIVVLVIIMAICLAAISTLYFVEHSKQIDRQYFQQIDRQYFDSHLESNALINSSFPINGGGFGNNIDDSINYRNHMPKKGSLKTLPHHNTQNASIIVNSPVSSQSVVELAPPNIGSSSLDSKLTNDKLDMDAIQTKTTTAHQLSLEEQEKHIDYQKSLHAVLPSFNRPNDTAVKRAKMELNKYDEATTQKVLLKTEKPVGSYPIGEPHETSNSIAEQPDNAYSDVYTNFIDDGQQLPRNNGSKTDDNKNIAKTRNVEGESRNLHTPIEHTVYEREYQREHKIRYAIGLPSHCETSASKTNRTICPSSCAVLSGHESSKVNQVSALAEVPEIVASENLETIETSTAFKPQKSITTKLLPVERKIDGMELSTTLTENVNHSMVEQTTTKDKIESSSQGPSVIADKTINRMSRVISTIQSEQPIEIRDSSSVVITNTPSPIMQFNYSDKVEPIPGDRASDLKPQEMEPLILSVHDSSEPTFNDIKPPLNKKTEIKFEKPLLPDEAVETPKSTSGMAEALSNFTPSTQTTTSAPNPTCLHILLLIRSETFNITLGYDEICRNFNITYNIPLSKYMTENRFELIFETQNSVQWTLCTVKEGTGKDSHVYSDSHNITDKSVFYPKGSNVSFVVEVPATGDFERQMEFQANLQPSDLIPCRPVLNGNPMQTVLYKINIYRDCTQQ